MSIKATTHGIRRRSLFVLLVEYPIIGVALVALWWFFGWTYLLGGVALFVLLLLFNWWAAQPAKNRLNIATGNFRKYMETLFYRGYDRGVMVISSPDGKRYMQFIKYITETGVILQFQFPRASWSSEYYEPLKDLLRQRHYDYYVLPVTREDKFPDQTDEIVLVPLEQDLEAAVELAKLVLLQIFKLHPGDTATVWYGNVSLRDEKIGF